MPRPGWRLALLRFRVESPLTGRGEKMANGFRNASFHVFDPNPSAPTSTIPSPAISGTPVATIEDDVFYGQTPMRRPLGYTVVYAYATNDDVTNMEIVGFTFQGGIPADAPA